MHNDDIWISKSYANLWIFPMYMFTVHTLFWEIVPCYTSTHHKHICWHLIHLHVLAHTHAHQSLCEHFAEISRCSLRKFRVALCDYCKFSAVGISSYFVATSRALNIVDSRYELIRIYEAHRLDMRHQCDYVNCALQYSSPVILVGQKRSVHRLDSVFARPPERCEVVIEFPSKLTRHFNSRLPEEVLRQRDDLLFKKSRYEIGRHHCSGFVGPFAFVSQRSCYV